MPVRIILDDVELDQSCSTVVDAVRAAAAEAGQSGRLISEVILDGQVLGPDQIEEVMTGQAGGEVLECRSTDAATQIMEVIEACIDTLDRITAVQQEATGHFQSGRQQDALTSMTECIELWDHVQDGVANILHALGTDEAAYRQASETGETAISALTGTLRTIRHAAEAGDWVAVSDTIGYEMEPVIEAWQEMLTEISGLAAGLSGSSSNDG
ncbi:MAG: hypothetical protein HND57_00870 [Planctomycetes bacterium]|nr:hypothetical protein [Planctomycetota bacterium]